MRVGIGYDVHRFTSDRKLVLGGVTIPFEKGLAGHSDADALTHALCDALLGAAGLGDIGYHFPDTDPEFQDIYSLDLLRVVVKMIRDKGFAIVNADTIIFAQAPKMAPYRGKIRSLLANALEISEECVNIKAKTGEGMGFIGEEAGIAAQAVVLLESASDTRQLPSRPA